METGDFNGAPLHIEVRMLHEGDLILDASNSEFVPDVITAFESTDLTTSIGTSAAPHTSLTLHDRPWNGDYIFMINGTQKGQFEIHIFCESDSPTTAPTTAPSMAPSRSPSFSPTTDPTVDPTADPTSDPTRDPTQIPTQNPTVEPTEDPTEDPSTDPTADPTEEPTVDPSSDPTLNPTAIPT